MPCTGPSLGWDLSTDRAHGPRGPGGETEAQRGEGRAEDHAVSQSCPRELPVLFSFSRPDCSLRPLCGESGSGLGEDTCDLPGPRFLSQCWSMRRN